MSKESFVFLLGAVVFFVPFIGVPRDFKEGLLMACGVLLMAVGYRLRRIAFLRSLEHESGERRGDTFVESGAVQRETTPAHRDDSALP